jgi:uncharacterized protein YndB with AHSA1/START domain
MQVDVLTEITIDAPPERVAAFASEPENAPRWYANIQSVEWKTEPPLRVGAQIAFVAQFLGKRMAYTYEIVEWIPSERLVMRTAEGPFPMETTYAWATEGQGTRMTLRNAGQPSGFAAITAPLMVAAMRKANEKDLAQLKALLENER